jgi:hemerythrin-like domain-containing protein
MSQPIRLSSLVSAPGSGFDKPFEMLHACHERLERMLALLWRLRRHLHDHGADEQARQAAGDVMRYFDQAAPQHHRDEERHVFPPLLAQADPATVAVVLRLQQEHLQMESRWAAARVLLSAIAQGELQTLVQRDEAVLDSFAALYAGHIEAEEQIAYPAALAMLEEPTQREMGREMAQRRGVK